MFICRATILGMESVHMKKVGILVNTDLMRVSLSPEESKVEQPNSLVSILFSKGTKSSILGLAVQRGRPRYLCGRVPILQPSKFDNSCIFSGGVLMDTKVI